MKGGAYPSPFAALYFPDSKMVPFYCWVDLTRHGGIKMNIIFIFDFQIFQLVCEQDIFLNNL